MSIRVLLVDDHKILRDALKGVLEREQDIAVVGEANDGAEGLALARELQPDIVLMDIGLPVVLNERPSAVVITYEKVSE